MKENSLLASVALFSELYNNPAYTNIYDIIAEFIKGAVVTENKWATNSTELKSLLKHVYDFDIPEAVIKTTVRKKLRSDVQVNGSYYQFNPEIEKDFAKINKEYNAILDRQNYIVSELFKYIETKEQKSLEENDKSEVLRNLNNFLLDGNTQEKHSKLISAFIIKNQGNNDFRENLNLIKEGVILYEGINYTGDINELGRWNTDLTIFLSTEHLFNALGYNGQLFGDIFNDFYTLVQEINASNKNKYGEKRIELKYLSETQEEIDAFFRTAELIKRGQLPLDPTKPAMQKILDGCNSPSDVIAKRVALIKDLEQKGIFFHEFKQSVYKFAQYNVEDVGLIESLQKQAEKQNRPLNPEECSRFFRIFTKINFLRGGESTTNFDNIGHIFMTGNRLGLYLAHNTSVKFQGDDIPFAKDIEFITNRFWFKLKKGFNKNGLPKSFDVVTKAQLILSAQINQSVSIEFQKLQKEYAEGKLTKEQAIERNHILKEKPNTPEEITEETLDNSLEFLNNKHYYEEYHREQIKKDELLISQQSKIKGLEEEVTRNKAELLRQAREKKYQQYLSDREIFVRAESVIEAKKNAKDARLCLSIFALTAGPIIVMALLKTVEKFNEWMEKLGNLRYIIWVILVLLPLWELFGRAYLFNKDRVKNGFVWIKLKFNRTMRNNYNTVMREHLENEYDSMHLTKELQDYAQGVSQGDSL